MENTESILKTLGVGQRPVRDPFFDITYKYCKVFDRFGVVIEDEEELCHEVMKEFPCNACAVTFQNLLDYELHYHESHHFVCGECKKWRPTARLLEIHVQEAHDTFFQVLAQKQAMHQCFVSECDMKFKDPKERREHCQQAHEFPKNYRFDDKEPKKINKSIEDEAAMDTSDNVQIKKKISQIHFGKNLKQRAFTKKKNISLKSTSDSTAECEKTETKMKPVTMFVPRQVQQKSFAKNLTNNKSMEKNVLESGSIMELEESLPKT